MSNGLGSLIVNMAKIKYGEIKTARSAPQVKTPVPGGLHQRSAVDVSPAAYAVVQAMGGLYQSPATGQLLVTSVGRFDLFGRIVYRSYLSDGKSFIETVVNPSSETVSEERRLYTFFRELTPQTDDDVNQLRGKGVVCDGDGRVLSAAIPAIIGYHAFVLDLPNGGEALYPRVWEQGTNDLPPEDLYENIVAEDGRSVSVHHYMMGYGRGLSADTDGPSEYLYADLFTSPEGDTSYDVFLGVDLDTAMLTVFPA